ncbi:MAG: ABC transporter substrate-binding protein [Clostridia bacterium]|nr:ABC transporter substrate-binding protein [Clostridia bacterium]
MKKIISLLLVCLTLLLCLSACAPKEETPDQIRVYVLNGTTGFGMAKMMSDNKDNDLYKFTVQTDASLITSALINGDVDIAALPTNAAATIYNKTNGKVKILAINTLGCLYLLTKEGTTVNSFADLENKTVYVPAQNPQFIFTDLCKKNGLTPGTNITISTEFAQPADLRAQVVAGNIDIAVLPEPMVTMAISGANQNGVTITNAMDLTAEWNKVNAPGSLVQGCVVVRTEFLEKYPTAVENFLKEYKKSITFLNENPAEAAAKIVENGIFANATVAERAIPKCNICYIDGKDMKSAMKVYLSVLKGINANAIGGKLPSDDFYYIPE